MDGAKLEETRTNFTLPTPKRIDRYDVLGKIAEGGMAEIFFGQTVWDGGV